LNPLNDLKVLFSQPNNAASSGGPASHGPLPPWQEAPHAQIEFTAPPYPKAGKIGAFWAILLIILFSAVTYYGLSRYVITGVVIQGTSMLPTLHDGDRLLLNRWAYHYRKPQRGDLVVIRDPGHSDFAVKRIVGLPLDSLRIKDGGIYLNERPYSEPYLAGGTQTLTTDNKENWIMIGQNRFFVLGDNRSVSEDSRYYGTVRREQIVGLLAN